MKSILTALLVCAAGLLATNAEEEVKSELAPTGLTLVVCDSENNVLDTIVVPEGKVSFEYTFTVPEDMVEIRLFAIGDDRIIERYRDNLTEMYCEGRTDDKGFNDWGILEATVEDGVLKGFDSAAGIKPLKITKEMRAQIKMDIKEDKRSSLVTIKGEQDGAGEPATPAESNSEGGDKP